jgi:Mn2+/Fe2+ NRAMP family transporter
MVITELPIKDLKPGEKGEIASNKKLMGEYSLKGINKIVYWAFIALIFGTAIVSLTALVL